MPRSSVFDAMPPEHRPLVFSCQAYRWFRKAEASSGLPLCPDWNPKPDYGRGFAHFVRDLLIPWDQVAVSTYTFEVAADATQLDLHTVTATRKGDRLSDRRAPGQERTRRAAEHLLRSLRDSGSGLEVATLLVLYSYVLSRTSDRPVDAGDRLGALMAFQMRRNGRTRLPFLRIPESNLLAPLQHALDTLGRHTPGPGSVNGLVALILGSCGEQSLVEHYQPAQKKQEALNLRASPLQFDITPIGNQLAYCLSDGTLRRDQQNALVEQIHDLESQLQTYAHIPDAQTDAQADNPDVDGAPLTESSDVAAKAERQRRLQDLRTEFHERQLNAQSWIRSATAQLEWMRRDALIQQGVDPNDQYKTYPLITDPKSKVAGRLLNLNTSRRGPRTESGHARQAQALELQRQREQAEQAKKNKALLRRAKQTKGFKPAVFRQFCLLPHSQRARLPASREPRIDFFVEPERLHNHLVRAYQNRTYLSVDERRLLAPKGTAAASSDSVDAAAAACTEMLRQLETDDVLGYIPFLPDDALTINVDRNDHPWSTAAQERWKLYTAWVRRQQQQCATVQDRTKVRIWPPPIEICTHKTANYDQILLPRPLVLPKLILDWSFQKDATNSTPDFDLLLQFGHLTRFWLLIHGPWNGAQVPRLLFKRIETYLSINAEGRRC